MREHAAALFHAHYPALAGWSAAALGSEAAGHDVAAEAFTRLFARLVSVRQPRAFLYAVAANLIRDQWRAETRDRALSRALRDADRGSDVAAGPDLAVRDVIDRLPERLRLPVLLHYFADLPVTDVAQILNRPVGTIKRALFDAREMLAPQLLEVRDEP